MAWHEEGRLAAWVSTSAYVVIVIVAWGTNYPLMKLALQDMPPLTFSVVRLCGGAVVVACIAGMTRSEAIFPQREERLALACIGILQFASVLGLASVALLFLPAGRTVTLIYSMSLWAAVFDMWLLKSRLRWIQYVGIACSMSGLLLFLNPTVVAWEDREALLGVVLCVIAAVCWGLGAVLYRRRQWVSSIWSQTLWQIVAAGILLLPLAVWMESEIAPRYTPRIMLILVWNWLVPTAIAVWAWSKILVRVPASVAGQLLMFTPFVGIACSAWIFQETLSLEFVISALLITLGGVLTLLRRRSSAHPVAASDRFGK